MVVIVDTITNPLRPRHPEKVNRPDSASPPKPDWIRVRAPNTRGYADTRNIVRANGLHTVCEEAGCPNIGECWDKKHAKKQLECPKAQPAASMSRWCH